MAIKSLNPYLNFDGDASKAIQLYESALGAAVESLRRFADLPDTKPEHRDRVLHAVLRLGAQGQIMISDTMPGMPFVAGNNNYIALHFEDVAELDQKFQALAVGGKVGMEPNDTFWGARFGMLTDAHGVCWMFNCDLKKS